MEDPIRRHLQADEADVSARWERLQAWLQARYGRETGIEAVLFLIGIQSRGRGYEPKLQKEAKQDLIMEGTYCAFEQLGLYERVGVDEQGAWLWERTTASFPRLSVDEQEKLLRLGILAYFESDAAPGG
jgi:hypothetical protein